MAFDSTSDRAMVLGEFCGDGEVAYAEVVPAGGETTPIRCKTGETGLAKSVPVVDDEGEEIDLSDLGNLELKIERRNGGGDLQTCLTSDATLSVGGAGNSRAIFTPNSAVLSLPQEYRYSLRQVSTGRVLAHGLVVVSLAAS